MGGIRVLAFSGVGDKSIHTAVIADQEKLAELARTLGESAWLCVDTEADSLHAYPEKLCLMQFSTNLGDFLVDTLARLDLAPLFAALSGRELILHGADYDLRLLRKNHGFIPTALFDTMIAARLLGYEQFGLTHLVQRHLGIELEKGPQKMNWAQRPLTPRMENYARNDTRYLKPLSDALRADLQGKGRLGWLEETCAKLIRDCAEPPVEDPDGEWRMRGSDRLSPRSLAVLRELWHWRESEAVAANTPPFFVLSHDTMIELAREGEHTADLEAKLPMRMGSRRKSAILRAIIAGREVPAAHLPQRPVRTHYRPTMDEQRRCSALKERRDRIAAELKIDPTLIASRSTLVLLSQDWEAHSPSLMNWQREMLRR